MTGLGQRRRLGTRGPDVTPIGLGCAPIGNLFSAVSDEDAIATVAAAWDAGIRFFDTAPLYGHGLAELRLGAALQGRSRDEYVVATKVGRLLEPAGEVREESMFVDVPALEPIFDFSRDAVLRSIESSLDRLGLDRIDVVHVHDPDGREDEAIDGAFPTLVGLRDEGVIGAVGCGMNQVPALARFVEEIDLDCILLAGRYTLLDRSGTGLVDRCAERGVGVVIGGVFNSGLLVRPDAGATFDYLAAPPELLARARELERRCADRGARLPAAAIAFVLEHPGVVSVVIGARSPIEIREDAADAMTQLPVGLLAELDEL